MVLGPGGSVDCWRS